MTTVKFEMMPEQCVGDLSFYINGEKAEVGQACAAEIEDGPHAGIWMFTLKARAEEFCWKRGLTPEFVEASDA